jgi:hypothetical protein
MTGDNSGKDIERGLLDHLLSEAKLYHDSASYKELLAFVVKLRNVAPFNAMILQLQKPGVSYVASAYDWWQRFARRPKPDARPLLILWPFAPVVTVYDVLDTEGKPLPEDAFAFPSSGEMKDSKFMSYVGKCTAVSLEVVFVDHGDSNAGSIQRRAATDKQEPKTKFLIKLNKNHPLSTQFTTLAHELGHLYLGHLGAEKDLSIPARRQLNHTQRELEAESVAYIVCERNQIKAKSEKYLASFVKNEAALESLDVYQVMRAANQVETLLGLNQHTKFPSKSDRIVASPNGQGTLF